MPDSSTTQSSSGESKGWDWNWLYYMGTVLLGMDERSFWRCTPRKLFSLWEVHKKVNGLDKQDPQGAEEVYIDELRW